MVVLYNGQPASAGQTRRSTMIDELMQTGEAEMDRIQRLRGYL